MTIRLADRCYFAYAQKMFLTLRTLLSGMVSVLAFTTPPLYRHPARANQEALRGDFNRIGADIGRVVESFDE